MPSTRLLHVPQHRRSNMSIHAACTTIGTNIQRRLPLLSRARQRALARWVLGALLTGSPNGPTLIRGLADQGVAAPSTLADQWHRWLTVDAEQGRLATRDTPSGTLACGAALLRWVLDLWTGGPLVLGVDASLRRDDLVLLRVSVLAPWYRHTGSMGHGTSESNWCLDATSDPYARMVSVGRTGHAAGTYAR